MTESITKSLAKRGSVTFLVEGSKLVDIHSDTKSSEEALADMKQTDDAPVDVQGNTTKAV